MAKNIQTVLSEDCHTHYICVILPGKLCVVILMFLFEGRCLLRGPTVTVRLEEGKGLTCTSHEIIWIVAKHRYKKETLVIIQDLDSLSDHCFGLKGFTVLLIVPTNCSKLSW